MIAIPDLLCFPKAIENSEKYKKRHLLLGNGFSIACRIASRPGIFRYGSLFEEADFSSAPRLSAVFEKFETKDFEHVIKILVDTSRVVSVYLSEEGEAAKRMADKMAAAAEELKGILIQTIAKKHPETQNEIDDEQFSACRKFLSHFLGEANKGGKVYTLNYDLLLYWTLMDETIRRKVDDGFRYGKWKGETDPQNIHYLHGALHLYYAGAEFQKYNWAKTGKPILEQALEAMARDKFPLFVAEGESNQKLEKIKHSDYFYHSYKSFSTQMDCKDCTLFIFGHSFDKNDHHVLEKVAQGKVPKVYISLYGDPKSKENKKIRKTAKELEDLRKELPLVREERFPLDVDFFDAASAEVWGASK